MEGVEMDFEKEAKEIIQFVKKVERFPSDEARADMEKYVITFWPLFEAWPVHGAGAAYPGTRAIGCVSMRAVSRLYWCE